MAERLRLSVFGQLHKELRAWTPSAFRRAYLGAWGVKKIDVIETSYFGII
jgi:hypothetical protein